MQLFLMLKLFDVRTLQTGEDVPVYIAKIVASRVVAVVREIRTAPAFAGEMFTPAAVGESTQRPQPHPLNLSKQSVIEERREIAGR